MVLVELTIIKLCGSRLFANFLSLNACFLVRTVKMTVLLSCKYAEEYASLIVADFLSVSVMKRQISSSYSLDVMTVQDFDILMLSSMMLTKSDFETSPKMQNC